MGWSDGGFHWQAEDMAYDENWRLFSSDSEDGDEAEWYSSMADNMSDSGSEASSNPESVENDLENIADDPLFLSHQDLFN